jgi:hypothetical protein
MTSQESVDKFVKDTPTWPKFDTEANRAALTARAKSYTSDLSTTSCWHHAFLDLAINSKVLVAIPGWKEPGAPIPPGFERLVTQELRPDELRKRLNTDPDFAALYSRYANGEHEAGWVPPLPVRTERGGYSIPQHNTR